MELQSGIYAIISPSGKRYIGSTKNFARRWREHRSDLALGRHSSLWKAVKRVGETRKFLGYFDTKEAAWAAICHHGVNV